MNKKNIIIISPFFFPEPISTGKFNTEFVMALNDKGHNITVLCYHPFYPSWQIKKTNQSLKGIKVIRGGKFLFFSKKSAVRRLVLEVSFAFFILRKISKFKKNESIILPVFPPSLAFYCILPFLNKNFKKIGMVHDLQEIYSLMKKGFLNKLINIFIHKIEKKCYNNCDKLIFLSKEMKDRAKELYNLKANKLNVQYPFVTISKKKGNALENIFNISKKHVVYSGALGEKQNPQELYNFFNASSSKIENVIFHIFSQGEEFNKLKTKNTNSKILFHSLVKKEYLSELYDRSDIQIIPQKAGTSKGSLPSKLPNLLASNCKILLVTDPLSELDLLFKKYKLDYIVTSWNEDILIQALEKLINKKINYNHQHVVAEKLFTLDKMISNILR